MDLFLTNEKLPANNKKLLKIHYQNDEDKFIYMDYNKTLEYFDDIFEKTNQYPYTFNNHPLHKLLLCLVIFSPLTNFNDVIVDFKRNLYITTAKFYSFFKSPYHIEDAMKDYANLKSNFSTLASYINKYFIVESGRMDIKNMQLLFDSINRQVTKINGISTFQILSLFVRNYMELDKDIKFEKTNLLDIFKILHERLNNPAEKIQLFDIEKRQYLLLLYILLYCLSELFQTNVSIEIYGLTIQCNNNNIERQRQVYYNMMKNMPITQNNKFYII